MSTTQTPTTTTYTKLRTGAWGIKGPAATLQTALKHGDAVQITKRDGTVKTEVIDRIIWTGDGTAIASVEQRTTRRSTRQRAECTECGEYGPAGQSCKQCYEGHYA